MPSSVAKLYEHSASELAGLIASRQVSSREAVEAHLARIKAVNGYVNAVTVVLEETALEAADAADRGPILGPLHGVPFTVKESIDCLGSATTLGVPALKRAYPSLEAPAVARMKAAGAIPIGRTNLSEFGMRLGASNPLRGATLNPWSPGLTPGGSSGGDAAALATGMTPFGLGSDMGGSLRFPAYCCGIAALKPTAGRIAVARSLEPLDFGIALQTMLVEGPMARTVADLHLGLAVLAGRDIRDPRSVDAPLTGPHAAKRAALATHIPGVEIHPVTLEAIRRAGRILADNGWDVEEAGPPELEGASETWGRLMAIDLSATLNGVRPMLSDPLAGYLTRLCRYFDVGKMPNLAMHAARSRLARIWSGFFAEYPVMIGPNCAGLPWAVDADLDPEYGLGMLLDATRFLIPGSLLGMPSLALPMGIVDRLPTGIQIHADLWREDLCLDAAKVIESGMERSTPIDPIW
ncbi:MAG: aam 1 [Fibrobacteres bacterium]|nr:aam 1 [Fibrobacterota bacterium]